MSKKHKTNSDQGTYAICITAGLVIGVGLGPLLNSVAISAVIGLILGTVAAYYFTHQKRKKKRH